jgi:hypothetical protein
MTENIFWLMTFASFKQGVQIDCEVPVSVIKIQSLNILNPETYIQVNVTNICYYHQARCLLYPMDSKDSC